MLASGLPSPRVCCGSIRGMFSHAFFSRDVPSAVPANAHPLVIPRPSKLKSTGDCPCSPCRGLGEAGMGPGLPWWLHSRHELLPQLSIHGQTGGPCWPLLPLPLVGRGCGVNSAAVCCLPTPECRQHSNTAHSEPVLRLSVDIQAPALAVGPTACAFHREYLYRFA